MNIYTNTTPIHTCLLDVPMFLRVATWWGVADKCWCCVRINIHILFVCMIGLGRGLGFELYCLDSGLGLGLILGLVHILSSSPVWTCQRRQQYPQSPGLTVFFILYIIFWLDLGLAWVWSWAWSWVWALWLGLGFELGVDLGLVNKEETNSIWIFIQTQHQYTLVCLMYPCSSG